MVLEHTEAIIGYQNTYIMISRTYLKKKEKNN